MSLSAAWVIMKNKEPKEVRKARLALSKASKEKVIPNKKRKNRNSKIEVDYEAENK